MNEMQIVDIPPGVYSHHGGGLYTVLYTAEDSTNAREKPDGTQPLVVHYISLTTGKRLVRDYNEFTEMVKWPDGGMAPRFRQV